MRHVGLILGAAAALAAGSGEHGESSHEAPNVVGLTSSFFVGGGAAPGYECTIGIHRPPLEIGHTFGAGGGGEVWHHSSLLITLDGRSLRRAQDDDLALLLEIETERAPFKLQASTMFIGALPGSVESPMHQEAHGRPSCPPRHCLIPQPQVAATSQPHCGWEPPLEALSMMGQIQEGDVATMEVDLRPLLRKNSSSLKVWAAPTSLSDVGMWQTPRFLLRSLKLGQASREIFV